MSAPSRILYCHCAYAQVVPKAVKEEVLRKLGESGRRVRRGGGPVRDVGQARPGPEATGRRAADGGVKIAACYPRAVKWLFSAADAPLPERGRGGAEHADRAGGEGRVRGPRGQGFKRSRRAEGDDVIAAGRPRASAWCCTRAKDSRPAGRRPAVRGDARAAGEGLRRHRLPRRRQVSAAGRGRSCAGAVRAGTPAPVPDPGEGGSGLGTSPSPRQDLTRPSRRDRRGTDGRTGDGSPSSPRHRRPRRGGVLAEVEAVRGDGQAPQARQVEALVPGHRLRPLHQLHAVPELLPVRRLRRLASRQDPGPEREQLQDRLPRLLARLPGSGDPVPQVPLRPDQRRRGQPRRPPPRGDEGRHLRPARRRHLRRPARPQRQGQERGSPRNATRTGR